MLISKSKYLQGIQCIKLLHTALTNPEELPKPDEATKFKFEQGNQVGELAKQLFPEGIDIPQDNFLNNLKQTKALIKNNKPLFEPSFKVNNLYSRADILEPTKQGWNIIEVKSSSSLKDINIHDVAFQKYVYEQAGLKINKCYLMHLNKEYVRKGKLDIKQLFIKEDITEQVNKQNVETNLEEFQEQFNNLENIELGKHCKNPYECPLYEKCKSFLPKNNHVLDLTRAGKKAYDLINKGILHIKDIPDNFKLTAKQEIQLKVTKEAKEHINKNKIKDFLDQLKYPLYYLDFETFQTAVPMYEGCKPWQQIPFQFSLHVVDKDTKHHEFLAKGKQDPRKKFIEELKKVLGDKGSIVVYNQSFEINRLKELAEIFPAYKEWVGSLLPRIIDLIVPFRNFDYYHHSQCGSASIKKVLPALCNKGYEDLEINKGDQASLAFFKMMENGDNPEIRKKLLDYCCLDTEGMIWIVDRLREIITL